MKAAATKRPEEGRVLPRLAAPAASGLAASGTAAAKPGADFANVPVLSQSDANGKTPDGVPCNRDWFLHGAGSATWGSGMSQKWLDTKVRVLTENDKNIETANAGGSNDRIEAVYFGRSMGFTILKVPDHCTVEFKGGLTTNPYACCNNLGIRAAEFAKKDTFPRHGTEAEFGVKNDWDKEPTPAGGKK